MFEASSKGRVGGSPPPPPPHSLSNTFSLILHTLDAEWRGRRALTCQTEPAGGELHQPQPLTAGSRNGTEGTPDPIPQ